MTHFLDAIPFAFSNPGAHALWELLWNTLPRQKDVLQIVTAAEIGAGLINWEQPMHHVWYDILYLARSKDKLRPLLDKVRSHPSAGSAVTTRLDELLRSAPVVEAAPDPRGASFVWRGGDEALTGDRDTMLDVAFLELGATSARSVVRLLVQRGTTEWCGTGFLVAPDLVLTNHHVLLDGSDAAKPDRVVAWFDFERAPAGGHRAVKEVATDRASIVGEAASDWAAIRLAGPAPDGAAPLSIQPTLPVGVDDRVYIVQHPAGGPKKIGMHHNEVRYVDSDLVQYLTDTLPGSSGAPVFNERWEVVALHHRSVDRASPEGAWEVRNQGIRIERVRDGLVRKGAL
jgi:V8-like Glu-specific endopeptidase